MPKLGAVALAATRARSDSTKDLTCGFCSNGTHRFCPRAVTNGAGKIWPCACRAPECGGGSVLRCLTCKNETPGEVSPVMWQCLDPEGCDAQVQKNLARNPGYQQIKEIVQMPKTATAKATPAAKRDKPKAEPRDCACACGNQTKGGLFLPGHDATLLSAKVKQVGEARYTQAAIKAATQEMRAVGASEALLDKLGQRITLAKARAVEKAAVPPPAKKAAVKPAAKKAAAKKTAAASPPEDDDF